MMIYEYPNIESFVEAAESQPHLLKSFSPGHVRTILGLTRQAVYHLVKNGRLDEIRIGGVTGHPIVLITYESLERYRVSPGRQRSLKFRQRLLHELDRARGSWPNDSESEVR